jgi:hypothetical protein
MGAGPDPRIGIKRPNPNADQLRVLGVRRKELTAAIAAVGLTQPSSGGRQCLTFSSPRVTRNEPGTVKALTENAVPVRCWQRWQWQ